MDAGDVVDHDGVQRGPSLSMAVAMKTSVACAAAATTAPCSGAAYLVLIAVLPKTYFCNKDNIKIIKNRSCQNSDAELAELGRGVYNAQA